MLYYYYFITAGMVVERKPCVRGKMSENAMRRSKATACMYYYLIAEFYLVDRGLRHRLPGFSSMGRLVILP